MRFGFKLDPQEKPRIIDAWMTGKTFGDHRAIIVEIAYWDARPAYGDSTDWFVASRHELHCVCKGLEVPGSEANAGLPFLEHVVESWYT